MLTEKLPKPGEDSEELKKEQNPLDDPYSVESFAKQYEEKYGTPEEIAKRKAEYEKRDKEELAKLQENLDDKYEGKDKLTPEELEAVKTDFEDLSESVKSLYEELNQRDQENFSPLIFREHLDNVYHSAITLQSSVESKNIDVNDLNAAITLIVSAIEQIGHVGVRANKMKEDSESLQVVSRVLRRVFDSTENALAKLKSIEKEEADYLSNSLKRLSFSVEDRYGWVERKRIAFENY